MHTAKHVKMHASGRMEGMTRVRQSDATRQRRPRLHMHVFSLHGVAWRRRPARRTTCTGCGVQAQTNAHGRSAVYSTPSPRGSSHPAHAMHVPAPACSHVMGTCMIITPFLRASSTRATVLSSMLVLVAGSVGCQAGAR